MALTNKMDLDLLHKRVYKKIKLYDVDTKNYIFFILEHVLYDKIKKVYIKFPEKKTIYRKGKKQVGHIRNTIMNTTYAEALLQSVNDGFNEYEFNGAIKYVFCDAEIRELKIKYITNVK